MRMGVGGDGGGGDEEGYEELDGYFLASDVEEIRVGRSCICKK